MSRPRTYATEAVILRRADYGEADRMLTLMTPGMGKLRVMAKGARKITSRKAGHIDLFMRSQLLLAQGRTFDIVTQADLIDSHRELREDVLRMSYAHYLSELADQFAQEGQEDTRLYGLLVDGLNRLSTAPDPRLAVRYFEMQLLSATGYRPGLFKCASTGQPLEADQNIDATGTADGERTRTFTAWSPQVGGVLTQAAGRLVRDASPLSYSALLLLRALQTQSFETLAALDVTPEAHEQAERAMQRYMTYVLERTLKSVQFLRQLQR